ncbi:MAG: hypothetical protein BWY63_03575 [Chloroflexi bacterium ADurb.Bin360]|nr:MAG: hypothetical protein BWY63_03575 [Chloroflexi bacterium ADurb.Bin360]
MHLACEYIISQAGYVGEMGQFPEGKPGDLTILFDRQSGWSEQNRIKPDLPWFGSSIGAKQLARVDFDEQVWDWMAEAIHVW